MLPPLPNSTGVFELGYGVRGTGQRVFVDVWTLLPLIREMLISNASQVLQKCRSILVVDFPQALEPRSEIT